MSFRPIGSRWGKWDLHFHTPSSYDYKNKSVTNEQIVSRLESAGIVAVAITDHHLIDAPRICALQSISKDRITVFPGIELRSELGGKESVHLIGIFPDGADPEYLWTKIQGQLGLTAPEVQQKGDDRVYVHFEMAAELIHELGGKVPQSQVLAKVVGQEHRRAIPRGTRHAPFDLLPPHRQAGDAAHHRSTSSRSTCLRGRGPHSTSGTLNIRAN